MHLEEPNDGREDWAAIPDRIAGIYVSSTKDALIENTFFDHAGWVDGYETNGEQPPSMASHNIYIQTNNNGINLRDNIIMRGAGNDAQIRSGGAELAHSHEGRAAPEEGLYVGAILGQHHVAALTRGRPVAQLELAERSVEPARGRLCGGVRLVRALLRGKT